MEKKLFDTELEFKTDADQTGQFKAVFSWFDVIDKHGDVTAPGAFEEGAHVKIAYWVTAGKTYPSGAVKFIRTGKRRGWMEGSSLTLRPVLKLTKL